MSENPINLFIVRHGEAAAHWGEAKDPGLSDLGKTQALTARDQLLDSVTSATTIISSPLLRAQETAQPLADTLARKVEINDAFRELPTTVPFAERGEWIMRFMHETWDEQPTKIRQWHETLLASMMSIEQDSVIFSHFVVLNAIVGKLRGDPKTFCFKPDNASITHLRRSGDKLELVTLGAELETVIN